MSPRFVASALLVLVSASAFSPLATVQAAGASVAYEQPAAPGMTVQLSLPETITVYKNMDTGQVWYESTSAWCWEMAGNFVEPGHTFFECDLGKVAGVQQKCTKAATVHAVVVSPSSYVNAQAWCGGSYWADCFSYEPLENFVAVAPPSGACQGESPGVYNILDTVATGRPWWDDRAPKTHVGCGGRSYEASVNPAGGAVHGVFTVTCTFV